MNIKYNKPFHILDMKLIQVGKTNMYDVFNGERLGWEYITRVICTRDNKVIELNKKKILFNTQKFAIMKSVK